MNGVVSEAVPIVAIGMATRNAEDPLAQQIRQRMPDLAGLPVVDQTLGEPVDQPVLSLCRLQQDVYRTRFPGHTFVLCRLA